MGRGEDRRRRGCETERAKRLSTGEGFDWLKGREIVNEVEHWRVLQHSESSSKLGIKKKKLKI